MAGYAQHHRRARPPCHYIALRNKAGIDTLDADSTSLEQASNVDVDAFDALRVRGFCGMASLWWSHCLSCEDFHDDHIIDCAILIPDLTRHVDVVEVISGRFYVNVSVLKMVTKSRFLLVNNQSQMPISMRASSVA